MTYDDRQLATVRVKCAAPGCGIEYEMTQNHGPRDICIECWWKARYSA